MRRRIAALTMTAVSVVSVLAAIAGAWLNLRHAGTIGIVLAGVAVGALTVGLYLTARRRWLRITAICCGGLLIGLIAVVAWALPTLERQVLRVVARTPAPDGAPVLVVRQGHVFPQIDASYDAVLQTDRGPLSQATLMWEGPEEGDAPRVARFVGPHAIEIVSADGCTYRSAFDPITLRPDRVHRQPARGRCG